MFEPSVYIGRRRALAASLARRGVKKGLVLFPGNRESPRNYADNAYRFRQDSCFLYYFGPAEPDMAASIDLVTGRSRLYVDEASIDQLVWTGPVPSGSEYRDLCGANSVAPRSDFATDAKTSSGPPLYLPPYRADTTLELADLLGVAPGAVAAAASRELIQCVVAQRELKEERETAELEKAVDLTIIMHRAVMAAARPGVSEYELMAEANCAAQRGGGEPAFPAIATTRGAVLHNHGYRGRLAAGDLFLLDAGAETAEGYAGDLTSTFPAGPRYDDRQKAIYEIVLDAGEAGSSRIKPGAPFREAHFSAARAIASGLKTLGILRGDPDEAVAAGAHACFFPHGLGHQVGLDVHDMENLGEVWVGYDGEPKSAEFGLKSLRMAKPLKPGMVVTVEPGVYFIAGLIAAWRAQKKHTAFIDYDEAERWIGLGGIRNEENWLVTGTGGRRLGQPFDKSVSAMEGYRSGR